MGKYRLKVSSVRCPTETPLSWFIPPRTFLHYPPSPRSLILQEIFSRNICPHFEMFLLDVCMKKLIISFNQKMTTISLRVKLKRSKTFIKVHQRSKSINSLVWVCDGGTVNMYASFWTPLKSVWGKQKNQKV